MSFISNFIPSLVSLKHNKRKREVLFEKDIIEDNGAYGKFENTKEMSPLEFKKFQAKLLEDRKRSRRKFLIVYSAVMVVVVTLIVYFLFYYKVG